jgi:hypothetical protein
MDIQEVLRLSADGLHEILGYDRVPRVAGLSRSSAGERSLPPISTARRQAQRERHTSALLRVENCPFCVPAACCVRASICPG